MGPRAGECLPPRRRIVRGVIGVDVAALASGRHAVRGAGTVVAALDRMKEQQSGRVEHAWGYVVLPHPVRA